MERLKTLTEILESYPTDKVLNGYAPYYEELFNPIRETVTSLCEIGIFKGGSLQAWEEFFPNATITGIDNQMAFVEPIYGDRIFNLCADAGDKQALTKLAAGRLYDIIIDDGSHDIGDVNTAIQVLWSVVKPNGLYIIEDMGHWTPNVPMSASGQRQAYRMAEFHFRHNFFYMRKDPCA